MPSFNPRNHTTNFPITFPNAVICILAPTNRGSSDADHTQINSYTKTNFATWGTDYTVLQPWIAIGY